MKNIKGFLKYSLFNKDGLTILCIFIAVICIAQSFDRFIHPEVVRRECTELLNDYKETNNGR